ncbi:uncharacterized protein LOC107267051 [Cephus cinctus]|uniref:Uncharacterized protein LOC107267051 n=1 Tax=Cephus cinctus TaxID=211228 RepID=A0AAJ7BT71_CEPCN|nr:uncharacterized protein LOC107267051 [Cephus cinctus]
MQETWHINCDWDETLPEPFVDKWALFRQELNSAKTLLFPRRIVSFDKPHRLFIHGFCDASEGAYGACLYIQAEDKNVALAARLLCSKSRVAPIKATLIPRLELCSAVLLARLIAGIQRCLRVRIDGIQAWSDSTVALCWIRGDVGRWKTFVANRVTEIVQAFPAKHWNHVSGEENLADLISRGTSPRKLEECDLWWSGPSWLKEKFPAPQNDTKEPSYDIIEIIEAEERRSAPTYNLVTEEHQTIQEILDKFSLLTKIERVLAYCLRFIANLKTQARERALKRLSVVARFTSTHRQTHSSSSIRS